MARTPSPNLSFRQRGAILIAILALLGVGALYLFVRQLNASQLRIERDQITAATLVQAKEALIGYAITYGDSHPDVHGYLPCPDINGSLGSNPEGSSETCGSSDANSIGRLPWKTMGLAVLRDGDGECLWYAVSGTHKNNPKSSWQMNWDTNGFLQIFNSSGNLITPPGNQAVAVVFASGFTQSGQNRSGSDAPICGGNFTATNYLDNDTAHGINNADIATGQFIEPHTHRDASGNVVLTVNDRLILITKDDIFDKVMRRSDFATAISSMLNNPTFQTHLQAVTISTNKGTDDPSFNCNQAPDPVFCANWKEMLFLTQLPVPAPITIDGALTANCSRVLIFAGSKGGAQVRVTTTDKSNKVNYLEGTNLAAFDAPAALSANFSGNSTFTPTNPSADLLRCLP